jgi:hypothetical protein
MRGKFFLSSRIRLRRDLNVQVDDDWSLDIYTLLICYLLVARVANFLSEYDFLFLFCF